MIDVLDEAHGAEWTMYRGDCVEVAAQLPESSVDLSVFSPPFADLYVYSDNERDMGNCENDGEFAEHYAHLAAELLRITRPGRLACVHCSDLPMLKWKHGEQGLRDFPGELIRIHEAAGWIFHSRVTVWKDPVTEMQRTKAHGLLYKTIRTDSSKSRQGMADYLLVFRKPGNEGAVPVTHTTDEFPLDQWQQWASPVWMDIRQENTLNVRQARAEGDEKHMCPLQLDFIERCIKLWSNPGDVVFSPFGGVGSEPMTAVKCGRKAVAIELKESYFRSAVANLRAASAQGTLF